MMCPIVFYHHAKHKKLLMTSFEENVQKPNFLTFNPPGSSFLKILAVSFFYFIDHPLHAKFKKNRMSCLKRYSKTDRRHKVSFHLKILGRNQDFSKGSVWRGEVTFQSAWGERVLGRNLSFQISSWGGKSDFRQFTTSVGISDRKISKFSPTMVE